MRPLLPLSLTLLLGSGLQAGTPLSKAVIDGSLSKVQKALEGGEKVNDLDKWGWTPLMWSIYYRTTPITRFLLEKGADPNIVSAKGYSSLPKGATAMSVAAFYGLEEEATLMVKAGGRGDIVDDSGSSALDYARKFEFFAVADLLAKPGGAKAGTTRTEAGTSGRPEASNAPQTPPPSLDNLKLPASVNGTPLGKVYRKVVMVPFATSPAITSDYPAAMAEAQAGALEVFNHYRAFEKAVVKGSETDVDDQTLIAQVEITHLRVTSTAARVIAGPFAAKSYARAKVVLKEPTSGKVLREQELSTENNVWGAAFTHGYSDRSMPRDIGAIIATYVLAVGARPKA